MVTKLFGALVLLLSLGCTAAGAMIFANSETVMHEILGAVAWLLAAALLGVALLCDFSGAFVTWARRIEVAEERRAGRDAELISLLRIIATPPSPAPRDAEAGHAVEEFLTAPPSPVAERIAGRCAKCGRAVKAGTDWAGKKAKCPGCGGEVQFPPA